MGRRKKIIDADVLAVAREAFLQKGASASTREIAQSSGLSQAALLQRFGSKEQLFLAAVSPAPLDIDKIVGSLAEACKTGAMQHLIAITLRFHRQMEGVLPQVLQLSQHPDLGTQTIETAHEALGVPRLIGAWVTRLRELQDLHLLVRDAEPNTIVEAIMMAVHGVVFMHLVSPRKAPPVRGTLTRFVQTLLTAGPKSAV